MKTFQDWLPTLKASALYSELDIHFARYMCQKSKSESVALFLGALLASQQTAQKNACAQLSHHAKQPIFETLTDINTQELPELEPALELTFPDLMTWLNALQDSPMVGRPGERKPLILTPQHQLYLFRYWQYENQLVHNIHRRLAQRPEVDLARLKTDASLLFEPGSAPDWQAFSAISAVLNGFSVIAGGPGTGKTTTVTQLLALLLGQNPELNIHLAAPTGKAAARLKESIKNSIETNPRLPRELLGLLPREAQTLHRLLGYQSHSIYFRHNAQHLLHTDVLIIDEASMIDLALMSKLFQAVPPEARLILLGDKDQLASVEAGCVLGDICAATDPHRASSLRQQQLKALTGRTYPLSDTKVTIEDSVMYLQKSYRFDDTSGIGHLARAVQTSDPQKALTLVADPQWSDLAWETLEAPEQLPFALEPLLDAHLNAYFQTPSPHDALAKLNDFRILCALKEGPFGVKALNERLESVLSHAGIVTHPSRLYHGCPIMILQNDYQLNLFNGDIGVLWQSPQTGLKAHFLLADGSLKVVSPTRLPPYEKAWAMTVHKSQGSEFAQVVLVLPNQMSPVLTRELVYTGITRAKKQVSIWGTPDIFKQAIHKQIKRVSGLPTLLKDGPQ